MYTCIHIYIYMYMRMFIQGVQGSCKISSSSDPHQTQALNHDSLAHLLAPLSYPRQVQLSSNNLVMGEPGWGVGRGRKETYEGYGQTFKDGDAYIDVVTWLYDRPLFSRS